ncbi:hypothetical protein [Bifidobacterium callitrichidarum]|uniref:Uncharacterized protein n=1 Tax=Bifidobacterium callitrichidarum TaxID=2052941 RepID=A0A2U2NBY1_9BIFI|nr:hypothetical protein [Bifidobacterium callitrichidarum]PWG66632.1 hypothetical protein DF196_01655 [Bifidobacterium callitrichidarum]
MELGNLLFGNSHGDYPIDRNTAAADQLSDIINELGISGYGHIDYDNEEKLKPITGSTLIPTDRGVDVHNPVTGKLLARFQAYWWGDGDSPEADEPNLIIPDFGVEIRWYKYWSRDAYANQPFTEELVANIRKVLEPALTAAYPYVQHPVYTPVDWDHPVRDYKLWGETIKPILVCRVPGRVSADMYSHGFIYKGKDSGEPFKAIMLTENEMFSTSTQFKDIDDAKAWCERRARRWKRPTK